MRPRRWADSGGGRSGDDGGGVGGGRDITYDDPLLANSSISVFSEKDGWTDGPMDLRTYGQTLLKRCEDASKKTGNISPWLSQYEIIHVKVENCWTKNATLFIAT